MDLTALQDTIAKKDTINSTELKVNAKRKIDKFWECPVEKFYGEKNNHYDVELGHGAGRWFFYKPHVRLSNIPNSNFTFADKIVKCCKERDYPLNSTPNYINLISIEGCNYNETPNSDKADKWNDLLVVLVFDSQQKPKVLFKTVCTTEPGRYYTLNPLNWRGGARMALGYHERLWQLGYHRGYSALVQGNNKARLVRDKNKDGFRNDPVTVERGRGINLHTTKTTGWRGSANKNSIGRWSAGCTVIYSPKRFLQFMSIVKKSPQVRKNRGYTFDYILLDAQWL